MNYYFTKTLKGDFDQVKNIAIKELNNQGFDVLTEIDMKKTLKNKIGVDFYNYQVLGVCNPSFVYVALKADNRIGTLLPCNIIIQEKEAGKIEVSATNPLASMKVVNEVDIKHIAWEIRAKLEDTIKNIH